MWTDPLVFLGRLAVCVPFCGIGTTGNNGTRDCAPGQSYTQTRRAWRSGTPMLRVTLFIEYDSTLREFSREKYSWHPLP